MIKEPFWWDGVAVGLSWIGNGSSISTVWFLSPFLSLSPFLVVLHSLTFPLASDLCLILSPGLCYWKKPPIADLGSALSINLYVGDLA